MADKSKSQAKTQGTLGGGMLGLWRGRLALAAVLLGLLLGGGLIACSQASTATPTPTPDPSAGRAKGPTDAPVQIVVYADFQCPACYNLHQQVEPELIKRYVDTGKAHIEIREIPGLGPDSQRAAEAAWAAADQGKFWEYRAAALAAWRQEGKTVYSYEGLKKIASEVGLNAETFAASLDNGAHKADVEADRQKAVADGLKVVPVVIINGQKLDGVKPLDTYTQIIDEILSKEGQ